MKYILIMNKIKMNNRWILSLGIFCLILGCKAPIQLTRITVTEHFTQNFDFSKIHDENEKVKLIGEMLDTEKVLDKFQKYINSPKGETTSKALLTDNSVGTDGIMTFTITLLPFKKKPKKFDVNGIGNYDIINNKNDEIYFSSTIHFTGCKNCDDINKLINNDSFSLEITFTQIAINQFNQKEFPEALPRVSRVI